MTSDQKILNRQPDAAQAGLEQHSLVSTFKALKVMGVDLHSMLLFHDGQLVLEQYRWPYSPNLRQIMHSVAKSFMSAGIGLAIAEGHFALTDRVVSFFPDCLPPDVSENLAAMTVEDLLTMRTGHAEEISGSIWRVIKTSWIAEFFKVPVVHKPGTTYVYTSAASYMLSAILTRATGQLLHDYLKPRLFQPLGITGESWDIGVDNINPGGNGLTCKPMDLLKLGILYSEGGMWEGRQLLPADWVAASVKYHTPGDAGYGYGYQWHIGPDGQFYATGLFGQVIGVFPKQKLVMAMTSATNDSHGCMQMILPLLQKAIPAIFQGPVSDPELRRLLEETQAVQPLVSLAHPAHKGAHIYSVLENTLGITRLAIDIAPDRAELVLEDGEESARISVGIGHWLEGVTSIQGQSLHHGYRLEKAKVLAGARWLDGDTLEMTWIFLETIFIDTVVLRFGEGQISLERSVNANSRDLRWPVLIGRE